LDAKSFLAVFHAPWYTSFWSPKYQAEFAGSKGGRGVKAIDQFIERDSYAAHIGVEITGHGAGWARAKMTIAKHHLNSAAIVHGGAIFSLADAAFSAASNSHGTLAVAINASIDYFKATESGTLFAEAGEVSLNRKLATYSIAISDEAGSAVARFTGTVYRKSASLDEILRT
jgi:acyl-CoA thioesterase